MATKKASTNAGTQQMTVDEMRQFYETKIKKTQDAINVLRDVEKNNNRTISTVEKEQLRQYLKNIASSEKNLRGLSRYLYYRSHIYFRIVKFFANMIDLNARSVIPDYNLIEDNDKDAILSNYYNTLKILDKMNLQSELIKMYVIALREDVAFGCVYFNPDEGMFIMPLDPDYCKINGFYATGDFSFKFDMSYWKSRQDQIKMIGEPWTTMWRKYQNDQRKNRWQSLPDQYAFAIKFRSEDYDLVVPPFLGMFNALLSLINLEDIQALNDEQQIYKLVYMPMDTIQGSKDVDDWCVSPDIMVKYLNKLINSGLPEDYTTAAIVPGKELKMLDFSSDASTDVNRVSKATQTLLDTAGGGELLMGSNINSTAAFNAAMKANTEFAISTLLPQTQNWVNRFLKYYVTTPCYVKFFEISIYTRDEFRKNLLESAQYGLPNALAVNTLNGFSELQTMSLNFLEQECLNISQKFVPLNSSFTSSNADGYTTEVGQGAPEKDATDLTDSGDKSRNK